MKDSLGHGSNSRNAPSAATIGNHQHGILRLSSVDLLHDPSTGAGRNIWQTIASGKRRAVAERIAQNARADKQFVRVR